MADFSTWDKAIPSGTSQVRDFPALHRSDKSTLEATLNDEHYFASASSLSAGNHKPGSAAPYYGATSAISTVAKPGYRLFIDTSTNELYALSSTATFSLSGITVAVAVSGFNPVQNEVFS